MEASSRSDGFSLRPSSSLFETPILFKPHQTKTLEKNSIFNLVDSVSVALCNKVVQRIHPRRSALSQVIQRIFYVVNRSWTGRITMMELRRSNFLQTLALLEEEDDINQITDYFSYEHFYVIYCKFWELDTDHDLYIDHKDLARYNEHGESCVSRASEIRPYQMHGGFCTRVYQDRNEASDKIKVISESKT